MTQPPPKRKNIKSTLEMLARSAFCAKSEMLHDNVYEALHDFPDNKDVVVAFASTQCKAVIFAISDFSWDQLKKGRYPPFMDTKLPRLPDGRGTSLWVFGNHGKRKLNAPGEYVRRIIVDREDIYVNGNRENH